MNRRQFLIAPMLAVPAVPALALLKDERNPLGYTVGPEWRYGGPYVDMGCLDMHIYVRRDERAYAFLTLHRYEDGQMFRGPFPAYEWDGPYGDMGFIRDFFPQYLQSPPPVRD